MKVRPRVNRDGIWAAWHKTRTYALASTMQPIPTTTASAAFWKLCFTFDQRARLNAFHRANGTAINPILTQDDERPPQKSAASTALMCLVRMQTEPRTIESLGRSNGRGQSTARYVGTRVARKRPNQSKLGEYRRQALEAERRVPHNLWHNRRRAEFVRGSNKAGHIAGSFPTRVAALLGHRHRCLSKAAGLR